MAVDFDTITKAMVEAGEGLGADVWNSLQHFAVPEFKKIATQIVAIETAMLSPQPPYTPEGARALLDMQVTASVGIIVAMTSLTLLAVQNAVNAVMGAIRDQINKSLGFALIA